MTVLKTNFTWIFDDVQFAIDIREEREKRGLTQLIVAQALGYITPMVVTKVENTRNESHIKVRDFMRLCQLFDLNPQDYYDFVRATTVDYFALFDDESEP